MKKIILGIFVLVSLLSNAQECKIEDKAFTGIFKVQGKTKPQSIQQDLTSMQNINVSPLRLDRYVDIYYSMSDFDITSKFDVTLDANGNETQVLYYERFNSNQPLVPYSKTEYFYDANGNKTLLKYYIWNASSQLFRFTRQYEYTYDANSNQTLQTVYNWNTTSQSFVPSYKYEYTYDANGNQTLSIEYDWNGQSFVPNYKYEYTYDANGNQTLSIEYDWNGQSFVPSSKNEYFYDTNGNQILRLGYSWNTTTQSFASSSKNEYSYDASGNQTLIIGYYWNTTSQSFVPNYKSEYTYDANGNLTLYISYDWDSNTQSLVLGSKYEYVRVFNNDYLVNFLTQWIAYKWYNDLGVYKPILKEERSITLDTDTQLQRMGVLSRYDTNFNVWNEILGDEFKTYRYYTKTALSTETIENNLISLYPNPTTNLLYVSHPVLNSLDIQITDLSGRQMYSGTMQKEVPLNVSSYAKGMYLVTIENKETNKKKTYKIIKK